jgi:hypothetical protein
MTLYAPAAGASSYGYGVTELGVKCRFIRESAWRPQIGIISLLEVPPHLVIGILVPNTYRHSCRYGFKRAKENGLRTEAAITGSIQAPEIGIGGLPESSSSAKSFRTSPLAWNSFTGPRNREVKRRRPGLISA